MTFNVTTDLVSDTQGQRNTDTFRTSYATFFFTENSDSSVESGEN